MTDFLEIDGSYHEGGGQILRTALSLSAVLQKPIKINNIRAGRPKPGLKAQHVVGVKAVQSLSKAKVEGLTRGSQEITFEPTKLVGGNFMMNIGTAGAVSLVLQTVLPVVPFLPSKLSFKISGGTDVPWSPPMDFVSNVLLRVLKRMSIKADVRVLKRGYFPKGGGLITLKTSPSPSLKPLVLEEFGSIEEVTGVSHVSGFPDFVARDLLVSAKHVFEEAGIDFLMGDAKSTGLNKDRGGGLTLWASTTSRGIVSASGLMDKKAQAEEVGAKAANDLLSFLKPERPVGPFLADQLIPFMGLARGKSSIRVSEITAHTLTNIWVAEQLLDLHYYVSGKEGEPGTISVTGLGLER